MHCSGLFLFLLLMRINLFDDKTWLSLRPLTYTRPVADLRIGILTIAEKWAKYLNADFGYVTQEYLTAKYPSADAKLFINGSVCPDEELIEAVKNLSADQVLIKDHVVIAYHTEKIELDNLNALTHFHNKNK